jgi:hypothetical protein
MFSASITGAVMSSALAEFFDKENPLKELFNMEDIWINLFIVGFPFMFTALYWSLVKSGAGGKEAYMPAPPQRMT